MSEVHMLWVPKSFNGILNYFNNLINLEASLED